MITSTRTVSWLFIIVSALDTNRTLGSGENVVFPGKDARLCYFVLWVETVNGVSYRLASGEALETWWESNREVAAAEVVLG